jgi:prephenate dehydrogenase
MNDSPAFFPRATVVIAGLGMMGGSLALALRGKCASLLGLDTDPEAVSLALQMNTVDSASTAPAELIPRADCIVLATPVLQIIRLLESIPDLHPNGAIVIDLGSTKALIVESMAKLPPRFDPIGGHPMCGKEKGGLAHAEASLFQGATFAFTPLTRTSTRARSAANELAGILGAIPFWVDPAVHDRWAAATSHLPYLAACALAAVVQPESAPLAGPGYRGATRLAESPLGMMTDILVSNLQNVIGSLRDYRHELERIETLLAAGDLAGLQERLSRSAEQRRLTLNPQEQRNYP